jgi:hypothetical protein
MRNNLPFSVSAVWYQLVLGDDISVVICKVSSYEKMSKLFEKAAYALVYFWDSCEASLPSAAFHLQTVYLC